MPSANGALSKLLCSCLNKKQQQPPEQGVLPEAVEDDRYELREQQEKLIDNEQQKHQQQQQSKPLWNAQKENPPTTVHVDVTTPIIEEAVEDHLGKRPPKFKADAVLSYRTAPDPAPTTGDNLSRSFVALFGEWFAAALLFTTTCSPVLFQDSFKLGRKSSHH
ncbi:hypothetical protein Q1695_008137 [Nippostrongylus brasiliensis]|nr:hypothetical protein Q1695_008137 [Nippostrongylus brasiliensis]